PAPWPPPGRCLINQQRNSPDARGQDNAAIQGRLRQPFALWMFESISRIPYDMTYAAEKMMEQGPGETKQDQFSRDRIDKGSGRRVGARPRRRGNQKPREQQRAKVEGHPRDSMRDRHDHGQHRAIDLQMRRERPTLLQAARPGFHLGHEPLPPRIKFHANSSNAISLSGQREHWKNPKSPAAMEGSYHARCFVAQIWLDRI